MESLRTYQMEFPMTRCHGMVFTIFVFCICVAFLCNGGFAESIQDATLWINKGKEAYQNRDYVSAIAAYDQALLLDEFYTEGVEIAG